MLSECPSPLAKIDFAKQNSLAKPYLYLQLEFVNNVTENYVFPAFSRAKSPSPNKYFLSHTLLFLSILVKRIYILYIYVF